MKKLITLAAIALMAGVTGVKAQGFVNFNTLVLGTSAQVRDVDGSTLLSGTGFLAQLYATSGSGASEGSLVAVGNPVNFRTLANAGYVQTSGTSSLGAAVNTTVQVFSGGTAGGPATVQLRAWSAAFSSYEAALNNVSTGKSALLTLATTGNGNTVLPVDLVGLQGFSLVAVPEPSTIVLGLMGGLGLLLRRRK